MALKRPKGPAGTLVVLEHTSQILKGNPLGDPHVRKLAVWLPPQYDGGARQAPLPGALRPGRLHRLGPRARRTGSRSATTCPSARRGSSTSRRWGRRSSCFPDCFTALGGNQYVNSSAIGDYADYLTREIIPFVDREFRTLASREHRGCFGKSSGGYGAIIHGMKYAKYWGAIADHSGDAYFDFVYWHDWPNTLNELAKYRAPKRKPGAYDARREARRKGLAEGLDDGRIKRFLDARVEEGEARRGRRPLHHEPLHGGDLRPRPEGAARLSPAVQPRDRRADRRALAAAGARTTRSTWSRSTAANLQVAARHLHRLRLARPVPHPLRHAHPVASASPRPASRTRYEEFDDDHSDIDYRMDVSLPFLYGALKP